MSLTISWNKNTLSGKIILPASKSLSNRALIISALSSNPFPINNLSGAEDTQNLVKNLEQLRQYREGLLTLDVGPAGTNMRFLTAFLATKPGTFILKGTERMHQRPVKPLVSALQQLGASIEYLEKEGYPPLKIHGKTLNGGRLRLPADISSQFVSALMMIGPSFSEGLEIILEGDPVSFSYIRMTAAMMIQCGASVELDRKKVLVKSIPYQRKNAFTVEADWSSASYWYGMLAMAESGGIVLPGLQKDSLQGDRVLSEWMKPLGVVTTFEDGGVRLAKAGRQSVPFHKDFTLAPDLAQTFIVLVAGQGQEGRFTGLKTLRIKETDRLEAMKAEMLKCGIHLEISKDSVSLSAQKMQTPTSPIHTYHDHRMAMAFAMLAINTGTIEIDNPEVVKKSYPGFWEDLERAGAEFI